MFTFEDLLTVPETGVRELLGRWIRRLWRRPCARVGRIEELYLQVHVVAGGGDAERRYGSLGPVKSKEINKAQLEAVAIARKLEAEGKLSLNSEGDDEFVT